MIFNKPLVSIGMPVFNEQRFIDESLSSLRAQTYANFEIIVCDNASTDGTLEICRRHAADDSRIRIDVAASNRGVTANFNHAQSMAQGKYFMWACGHDVWSPGLLEECVGMLERRPQACIAFASSRWIGVDGETLSRQAGWSDTRGMPPLGRFHTALWGNMHPVLGLLRRDAMQACGPIPAVVGGDLVFLSRMSLHGEFLHASGSIWSRREFRTETSYGQKVKRYASRSFGMATPWHARWFPLLALPLALARTLTTAPLPLLDRVAALVALPGSLLLRYLVGRRVTGE